MDHVSLLQFPIELTLLYVCMYVCMYVCIYLFIYRMLQIRNLEISPTVCESFKGRDYFLLIFVFIFVSSTIQL